MFGILGAFTRFLRALFGFGFALGVLLGNDVGDDLVELAFIGLQLGEFLAAGVDVFAKLAAVGLGLAVGLPEFFQFLPLLGSELLNAFKLGVDGLLLAVELALLLHQFVN